MILVQIFGIGQKKAQGTLLSFLHWTFSVLKSHSSHSIGVDNQTYSVGGGNAELERRNMSCT